MKTYKIGRDLNSFIQIEDASISRNHAILCVHAWGKMEIIDMSANGTTVNGTRVATQKPFPVSRKDIVSFAGVRTLDWDLIPNPLAWVKWVAVAGVALMLLLGVVSFVRQWNSSDYDNMYQDQEVQCVDKSGIVENGNPSPSDNPKSDVSEKDDSTKKAHGKWYNQIPKSSHNKNVGKKDSLKTKSKQEKKEVVAPETPTKEDSEPIHIL